MAPSTSASIEWSVPSPIWRTIGSTSRGESPLAGAGRSPSPPAPPCSTPLLNIAQHQVAETVDLELEAVLHHCCRAVFLDDGGTAAAEAGGQIGSVVDGKPRPLVLFLPGAARDLRPPARPGDRADPGHLSNGQLDDLLGPVGVALG